ncbi:MAG: hypothetical protein HZC42_11100 [Candidatus Eisenbacteria bacterium]|nr:hypothetical protein [Candidatus Eisenbacteria bacterium]
MHLARIPARLRRSAGVAALGVLLAVVALSLTQCRLVDERLTGISRSAEFTKSKPEKCFKECHEDFQEAMEKEVERHVRAVHACAGDSVCLALEQVRHERAIDGFKDTEKKCREKCHHQGHGGGGR